MSEKHLRDVFRSLADAGIEVSESQRKRIEERINKVRNYVPKVGLFGKTGVGKSSLANALFGSDVCKISDVAACTRDPQEVVLSLAGNNGITLLDVPGVGESAERDTEYRQLYKKLLPELDVILWILKGDDRAFTSDQEFYENLVKPHLTEGKPFFFVINQIDKVEPFREWDEERKKPGTKQEVNICNKIEAVSTYFDTPSSKIIPVSANEKYNLVRLVDEIVFSLPPEKLVTFGKSVKKEVLSEKAQKHIAKSTADYVLDGAATGAAIGAKFGPVGAAIGAVVGGTIGWVCSWFDW